MDHFTRAVLWDLDGTLVDSEEYHWLAWQETLAVEGVRITREQFAASFGRRNASFLQEWLGPDAGTADVQRVGDAKEACYRRLILSRGCSPLPGAVELVIGLHEAGWAQVIASSAPRLNVDAMLDALRIDVYFHALVSSEDVQEGKPDPQVFFVGASRVGVPPARCVVVEDSVSGVEAARRAGMRSVGVSRASAPLPADLPVVSLTDVAPETLVRLLEYGMS